MTTLNEIKTNSPLAPFKGWHQTLIKGGYFRIARKLLRAMSNGGGIDISDNDNEAHESGFAVWLQDNCKWHNDRKWPQFHAHLVIVEEPVADSPLTLNEDSRLDQYDNGLIAEAEFYRLTELPCEPSIDVPAWGLVYVPQTIETYQEYSGFSSSQPCVCCKESVNKESHFLHLVEGGGFAVHPLFEGRYEGTPGDLYYHSICGDCLKKFPQLAFFAQAIDPVATIGFVDYDPWPSIPDPLFPDDPDDSLGDLVTPEMEQAWALEQERYGEARHLEKQAKYERLALVDEGSIYDYSAL